MFCSNTLYTVWTLKVRNVQWVDRADSSMSFGGSTHRRRTEQDITNEKMQRDNEEYNLQVQVY
jgi:hypothetical protein